MTFEEFKQVHTGNEVKVLQALIRQVRERSINDYGFLSDVGTPEHMDREVFEAIMADFKDKGIYNDMPNKGYHITIEQCFEPISKREEIYLLRTLKAGNGDFSDWVQDDIHTMINNIEDGKSIETDTLIHGRTYSAEQRNKELKDEHKTELNRLHEKMVFVASELDNDRRNEIVTDEMGLDKVIIMKRELRLDLNDQEIDYLITKLQ